MTVRRWLLGALPLVVLGVVLGAAIADARPGGGQSSSGSYRSSPSSGGYRSSPSSSGSYRSPSSSSWSSGSSPSYGGGYSSGGGVSYGGGNPIGFGMTALVGVVVVVVLLILVAAMVKKRAGPDWASAAPEAVGPPDLDELLQRDPAFSRAVFEDFVFELYAAAQRGRGSQQELALQPYLSQAAIDQLGWRGPAPTQVLVGTLRIERSTLQRDPARTLIVVLVEATLIGASAPVYSVERWSFVRNLDAVSRPPERTRTWPCPNCGAPWQPSPTRTCAHCGEAVEVGKFDWCVAEIRLQSETPALASLTGTVPEYGNELPTVVDPAADATMAQITADDPQVTFETLGPRVELIYQQLNTAWNASELTPVRGLVTASLRAYLEYWLREYAHQGLRNTLADARITNLELAKVTRDRFYDAITVRVFAGGLDSTSDARGRVVGGSAKDRRDYTEYWTLLRSSTRRGPVTTTPTCPNCGAPLAISDIGDCTHCGVAVENASFDWTLSKIEQDDNYAG